MASLSKMTSARRRNRARKMGRDRKAKNGQRSTLPDSELFAVLDEPKSSGAKKSTPKPATKTDAE